MDGRKPARYRHCELRYFKPLRQQSNDGIALGLGLTRMVMSKRLRAFVPTTFLGEYGFERFD